MLDELQHFDKKIFLSTVRRMHTSAVYERCVKELGDGDVTASQSIAALARAIQAQGKSGSTSVSMSARQEDW